MKSLIFISLYYKMRTTASRNWVPSSVFTKAKNNLQNIVKTLSINKKRKVVVVVVVVKNNNNSCAGHTNPLVI